LTTGNYTQPVSGNGGYLWGVEFSASVPFDLFTDVLGGWCDLSYPKTMISRSERQQDRQDNIRCPACRRTCECPLYYENAASARMPRYRSEYIGEVTNYANERSLRYVEDDMIDAQLATPSGRDARGLQVLFRSTTSQTSRTSYVEEEFVLLSGLRRSTCSA
jgi:hypothetical protein